MGTYTTNNNMYLVDLMFIYVNNKNIISIKISTQNLFPQLDVKGWEDSNGNNISAINVIKNKNKYKEHHKRIKKADLRYPIMLTRKYKIVDGMHRLTKAYLNDKKYIRAYIFDDKLMNKFKIVKIAKKEKKWEKIDWNYYDSLTEKDIENIYEKRFNK